MSKLPGRTTRELCFIAGGIAVPLPPRGQGRLRLLRRRHNNEPRRGPRQGILTREHAPAAPETVCVLAAVPFFHYLKRLSATDISALASMKNVAKCDTWCELQNPVNHRVFERKLRPKPFGRGHVCLGVTHRCPRTPPPRVVRGAGGPVAGGDWPPVGLGPRLAQIRVLGGVCRGVRWRKKPRALAARTPSVQGSLTLKCRRKRTHRDPRSGGITR